MYVHMFVLRTPICRISLIHCSAHFSPFVFVLAGVVLPPPVYLRVGHLRMFACSHCISLFRCAHLAVCLFWSLCLRLYVIIFVWFCVYPGAFGVFVYVRTSCLCIGFNPGDVWCCFRPVCRFRYFCVFWLGGGGVTFPHVFVHFHYLSHSRISLEMNLFSRVCLSCHVDYTLFV